MSEIENKSYVLDTSAWVTLFEDEEGAEIVESILLKSNSKLVYSSFMSFMEIHYTSLREKGEEVVSARLEQMRLSGVIRVESTPQLANIAAQFKATCSLSLADAWIAALAKKQGSILVHKDPEFEQLKNEIEILKLPYKNK